MRDLLKKYRSPIVLVLFLLGSLTFYSMHLRQKASPSALERRVLTVIYPLQRSAALTSDGLAAIWSALFGASAGTTAQLRDENLRLKAQVVADEEMRKENERLRKLLAFSAQLNSSTLTARVIGVDATSWFRTITIDRGSQDRVAEGMAVVTAQGVVGRVVNVAPRSSRVLLVVDSSSKVSTLVERTRSRGVCRGDGEVLVLDFLPLTADVQTGDILVTSGLGGGFSKGLVLGTVSSVDKRGYDMFQTVRIEPAVDFDHLEEVLVIVTADPALPTPPP